MGKLRLSTWWWSQLMAKPAPGSGVWLHPTSSPTYQGCPLGMSQRLRWDIQLYVIKSSILSLRVVTSIIFPWLGEASRAPVELVGGSQPQPGVKEGTERRQPFQVEFGQLGFPPVVKELVTAKYWVCLSTGLPARLRKWSRQEAPQVPNLERRLPPIFRGWGAGKWVPKQ